MQVNSFPFISPGQPAPIGQQPNPGAQLQQIVGLLAAVVEVAEAAGLGHAGAPAQGPAPYTYAGPPQYQPGISPQQYLDTAQGYAQLGSGWQQMGGHAGAPTVALIDDFGSSHAQEMQQTLNQGGSTTLNYNINVPGADRDSMIANNLQDVLSRVQSGQKIDAVSLSQQDFQGSGSSGRISQLIQQLQAAGVPVVVAAGNGGSGAHNTLSDGAALVAENAVGGQKDVNSGVGNVIANAQSTSFATAEIAAQAAALHAQGANVGQIVSQIQQHG